MLKHLKFPWLYVIELIVWIPLLAGFATTMAFVAAKPIATLDLRGRSLPSAWEAAIANHGKFLEGYLIANHPAAFSLGLLLLLGAAAALYPIHKAQQWQRESSRKSRMTAHNMARGGVAVVLVGIAYFVATHYVVGVSPV